MCAMRQTKTLQSLVLVCLKGWRVFHWSFAECNGVACRMRRVWVGNVVWSVRVSMYVQVAWDPGCGWVWMTSVQWLGWWMGMMVWVCVVFVACMCWKGRVGHVGVAPVRRLCSMMAMVRGDIHVLVILLMDCVCMMEMYVSMIWSLSHACVLSSVGSCSLCRSAVLMSRWLREGVN